MKTTKTIEISKASRSERNGPSEASILVNGKCVGFIKGSSNNVGSWLCPRWVITSYDVDVYIDDENIVKEFKTRGEAVAYARSLFA